jgi:hypothetical protein
MKKSALLGLLITIISPVFLNGQVLNVPLVTQEQDQWCWAGVTSCTLGYYCTPTPQCEIAEYTRTVATWYNFGSTDCCVDASQGCNYWNYLYGALGSIEDILNHFAGISNSGLGYALSVEEITTNIQLNRAFIIRWGWTTGGGHFIVGHGISGNNIYYMNPWYGEGKKVATYSWICNDGSHEWTHTEILTTSPNSSVPEQAGTISGNSTVCQGQNSVIYTVPVITGAYSYAWVLPAGVTGTSTTNSITVNYGYSAVSGNIMVKGHNGCGNGPASSLAITVNPKPATPVITHTGSVLHSDAPAGNQWYNQAGLIEGATNQDYTVASSGSYHVIVAVAGCISDPSNILTLDLTGTGLTGNNKIFKVYPNPVTNELIIEMAGKGEKGNFEISNSTGQIVSKGTLSEKTVIQTSDFSQGVYVVKIENGDVIEFKKIVKQ